MGIIAFENSERGIVERKESREEKVLHGLRI